MRDLKKMREAAGLTQAELEKMCGIDRSILSLAENRLVTLREEEEAKLRLVLTRAIRKRIQDGQKLLLALEQQPEEMTR